MCEDTHRSLVQQPHTPEHQGSHVFSERRNVFLTNYISNQCLNKNHFMLYLTIRR